MRTAYVFPLKVQCLCELPVEREGASSRYCCVPFCKMSSRFNSVISFHSFPLNKETRKKWLHNIRREDYKVSPNTRVCSRHFKGDDFFEPSTPTARRLLKKGAVPTLLMWSDSTLPPKRTGMVRLTRSMVATTSEVGSSGSTSVNN
uniref:THAP domain-containing protein 1 n=1 Tax=Sinocyclocheilus rhinocerous TaxID=307959 RepID=A0A673GC90_9TELE